MDELPIEIQLERLLRTMPFGEMTDQPVSISGGLMHRMYAVATPKGKFAIKALNPQIMLRPEAKRNFMNSERIAQLAAVHVPALPAKIVNGEFLHLDGGRYYLLFDWLDGVRLQPGEIGTPHCGLMGALLADIHSIRFDELELQAPAAEAAQDSDCTDWHKYARQGREQIAEWAGQLEAAADELHIWEKKSAQAAHSLAADRLVISHRDLDPKNVMWGDNGRPVTIDWEAAGFVHPMQELTETAIYWSENEAGDVEQDRFHAFISGYRNRAGTIDADWRSVLECGFAGKLGWLAYNLRRSLGLESINEDERRLGSEQAVLTLRSLGRYAEAIPVYERWLREYSA